MQHNESFYGSCPPLFLRLAAIETDVLTG